MAPPSLGTLDLNSAKRELIVKALEAAQHNRTQAARLLGLTRPQLYRRVRRHGLASTCGEPHRPPPDGEGAALVSREVVEKRDRGRG
jgi:hypothetical protein